MNHTASGLPRPDRTNIRGVGTKHTTNRNTLFLKSFCVTRKKWENRVGEHESIDYIYFVTITRNAVRLGCGLSASDLQSLSSVTFVNVKGIVVMI